MNALRPAVRSALKAPLFSLVAAVTLALGIGASTAIFSFVDAVLLRPLPWRAPEELGIRPDLSDRSRRTLFAIARVRPGVGRVTTRETACCDHCLVVRRESTGTPLEWAPQRCARSIA